MGTKDIVWSSLRSREREEFRLQVQPLWPTQVPEGSAYNKAEPSAHGTDFGAKTKTEEWEWGLKPSLQGRKQKTKTRSLVSTTHSPRACPKPTLSVLEAQSRRKGVRLKNRISTDLRTAVRVLQPQTYSTTNSCEREETRGKTTVGLVVTIVQSHKNTSHLSQPTSPPTFRVDPCRGNQSSWDTQVLQ